MNKKQFYIKVQQRKTYLHRQTWKS